jgi:hypothetical protein
MPSLKLNIEVRPPFLPLFAQDRARFFVAVCHRRAGKTVASVQRLIVAAMQPTKPNTRLGYIAPFRHQAKAVAWDLLKTMTERIPGRTINESELRVDFGEQKSRIQLYGADNFDALRGGYFDEVILDEVAQMPPATWTQVVRPMLADRKGSAIFIGTPQGKGAFFDLWEQAATLPDWDQIMLRASESGLVAEDELAAAEAEMGEAAFSQEFECSFTAAIRGAFYGKVLEEIEREGHMIPLAVDPAHAITTSWDLGVRDATSIWVWQPYRGNSWAAIDYYEATGEGVDHYAQWLDEHGYLRSATHLAPHDISNTDWSSAGGKNRMAVAREYGINFERTRRPANSQEVMEQINALRLLLPRVYFHNDTDERGSRVYRGRLALSLYRQDYNERLGALKAQPVHDHNSHAADAARTFAAHNEEIRLGRHTPWNHSGVRINISPSRDRSRARGGSTLGYSRR